MSRSDILLSTLNSSFKHAAFGLRYLFANLGPLKNNASILEFTTKCNPREIAETILSRSPRILGLGVYIWNTDETLRLARILKSLEPNLILVLGGPEVSYEAKDQPLVALADYVIQGEADLEFAELCRDLLNGERPTKKIWTAPLPEIERIAFPYDEYSPNDISHRVIYVEASRGCPYRCEYCLSSLDQKVRTFSLDLFLLEMKKLLDRGVRQFKFIDRTFNLNAKTCQQILDFFLDHIDLGLFLHFEMVPDRLPEEIRQRIARFPAGSLQFEIGVQTLNPDVARLVSRRTDLEKMRSNFEFLREQTRVHTHADLIVGLPGEDLASFAQGFNQLFKLRPDEIQIGHLKRLKGTPIIRHESSYQMVFQDYPPFQILKTKQMSFAEIQFLVRFAKFWDLLYNSGEFPRSMTRILQGDNPFENFSKLTEFCSTRFPNYQNGVALLNLVQALFDFLIESHLPEETVAKDLHEDYTQGGRRSPPQFLRRFVDSTRPWSSPGSTPRRQRTHLEHSASVLMSK
ncbi:MAG: DUF4080 domain-containing protein [Bdellovibrionales bacterium]